MKYSKLPNSRFLPLTALFTANLIWAIAAVVIKIAVTDSAPITILFIRFLIVCVLILPFTIYQLKITPINPRDLTNIVLLGIFSQTSIVFIFEGIKYTTVTDTVIISVIGPILAMAAGHYFYHEKVNKKIIIGVTLAIVGTVLVMLEPMLEGSGTDLSIRTRLWGNFLVFLNTVAFVFYVIWSKISLGQSNNTIRKTLSFIHLKAMTREYSPTLLTFLSFYIGLITVVPLMMLENLGYIGSGTFSFADISGTKLLGVLYLSVFSSIMAYGLYEWSLKKVSVLDSSIFGYLTPVLTFPFSFLILGEIPTKIGILGLIIITAGIVISEHHNMKTRKIKA